jgi:hypothetical protein
MKTQGDQPPIAEDAPFDGSGPSSIDYVWFDARFKHLLERLRALEASLTTIESTVAAGESAAPPVPREYYSVPEFAVEVKKCEYTVREWCRMGRIHAEKCDSGRGDAKSWKIPVSELHRFRDHGLLPAVYLR